ncbi:MAG: hypothetical protein AB1650_04550 [Candidatus Omnitrophota bacterium]
MPKTKNPRYALDENGAFLLENYNQAKPFSNFFPGVAGLWGIPMWLFYVNRGQCVSSFGIESKDKAMMEFLPANKAYRLTSIQGFRTFVKIHSGKKTFEWEPFQSNVCKGQVFQQMIITSHDLTIEEINRDLGIICRVNYFTVAEENFPALVRQVSFQNISKKEKSLEVMDGLPVYLPYGMNDWVTKNMSRTVEAWIKIQGVDKNTPYYHLNVEVNDTSQVKHIKEGNFYFSFEERRRKLFPVIVQPECVFGQSSDFMFPAEFFGKKSFRIPTVHQTDNRTPSAMTFAKFVLAPQASTGFVTVAGHAHSLENLNDIVEKVTAKNFIRDKANQNRDIIAGIKNYAVTKSANPVFDQYAAQTFLDNVMRGGLPVSLKTEEGVQAVNVFSRKHGDPERDYNYFVLSPTFFSQGNGNYRDVNQNRRNDIWFNTAVADSSIIDFFNLSQADGYNPLVVKGMSFFTHDQLALKDMLMKSLKGDIAPLEPFIKKGFQLGELLTAIEKNNLDLRVTHEQFLNNLLGVCHKRTLADHGEGFWTDHWTYNIDLVESYLSVFPEKLRELLLHKKEFDFYLNDHYVLPRSQRYVLAKEGVRQFHSVIDGSKSIHAKDHGNHLRVNHGSGEVYRTNLAVKILCLIANKAATLDPSGIGIEMEADKPGWYDALNGLPGLLGSSICETFELQRYAQFLLDALEDLGEDDKESIDVFKELADFIKGLTQVLSQSTDDFEYWDKSNTLKEDYRLSVREGIDGQEERVTVEDIRRFLNLVIAKTRASAQKAINSKGLFATYFIHEAVAFEKLEQTHDGRVCVIPGKFKCHALPLFLEGFVHALRVLSDPAQARKLYQALHVSPLYDKELKMYKVNADLTREKEEIGRTRVFPRGWLENESIWLHMEYKYLVELIRSGLYREFYTTMNQCLVPFLKPDVYGRSPLENSSFIASSAHQDPNLHGQGFVARLSGSTAEFLHLWLWMNVGQNPFLLNQQNELCFHFNPVLAKEMFTRKPSVLKRLNRRGEWEEVPVPKNSYAFHLFGSTLVVYYNPRGFDVFPDTDYQIERIVLHYDEGKTVCLTDGFIPSPYAADIRENRIERIDVHFA